ncbi:hypothetical protein H0O00_02630 [Candidatus Micrarchaeota archaeon]|nr:hypothetical protein [Candidatus Micrarchaeota archaeon]
MSDFTALFYGGAADPSAAWRTISIGAAAIAVLGSIMLIMLSRLFGMRNLEQVAKTEFVYAMSTVLIVIMVVSIIGLVEPELARTNGDSLARTLYLTSFGISSSTATNLGTLFPPGTSVTLIDWMKLYMNAPAQCIQGFMDVLYVLAIPVDAMTSLYMEIFMSEHASGFGVKWMSERIMNATTSLTFFIYINYLLGYVFDFVKYYAGFFFSIGVALRSFPPTRGAGAYLMAMAFGLYFVFPLSYMLVATFGLPYAQSNLVAFKPDQLGNPALVCVLPDIPDITDLGCGMTDPGKFMDLPEVMRANYASLGSILGTRLDQFGRHLISSICLFPMIAFVILLTFVLNTTNLFGGNIPEIGRGLVKLI